MRAPLAGGKRSAMFQLPKIDLPRDRRARPAMAGLFCCLLTLESSHAVSKNIVGVASKIVDGDTLYVCDESACEKKSAYAASTPPRERTQEGSVYQRAQGDRSQPRTSMYSCRTRNRV